VVIQRYLIFEYSKIFKVEDSKWLNL